MIPLLALVALPPEPELLPSVLLGVGEQRQLHIEGLERFSLGSDAVRAVPLPGARNKSHSEDLLIKGVRAGRGDLWIQKTGGRAARAAITVVAWDPSPTPRALWQTAASLQEVEIIPAGDGILLRGTFRSLREAALIRTLVREHDRRVQNLTRPDAAWLASVIEELRTWIQRSGLDRRLEVQPRGDGVRVTGAPADPQETAALERQIRARYPLADVEWGTPGAGEPTVFLRIFLLELHESAVSTLGVRWPGAVEGALKVTPWKAEPGFEVEAALEALSAGGQARLLSKPAVAVRVPGEAELFSGGEFPVRNRSHNLSRVEWKPHGLSLKLGVSRCDGDMLRMELSAEMSEPDTASGGEAGVPGLRASRLKTQVDARFGTPLLLSGLARETRSRGGGGIPFLSRIPLLGLLFGTQTESEDRSELLAVLIPDRAPPRSPLERLEEEPFPRGPVPPPRQWISPEELQKLRVSGDFPWNALR